MEHYLKTWPEYFHAVNAKRKKFEIRKNDRDFKVGDILILQEWDPMYEKYSGDELRVEVTYLLSRKPYVPDGYVCMSIKHLKVKK